MGFSKLRNGEGLTFYLQIDENGKRIESWKNNLKDLPTIIKIIDDKYGLNLIGITLKKVKENRDLDWAL